MSFYDYERSKMITGHSHPFYALIMAAARQADTDNMERLRGAFPNTIAELERRYHAPGGLLPSDETAIEV